MGSIQWHVNRYPKNYFLVVHRIWNLQSPNPQPHLQPYPQQERLFIMLVSSCPLNRLVYMSASQWTDWSAESPSTESTQPLASFTLYDSTQLLRGLWQTQCSLLLPLTGQNKPASLFLLVLDDVDIYILSWNLRWCIWDFTWEVKECCKVVLQSDVWHSAVWQSDV